MARKIILENIKSIKHLEFVLPESHGVYILVGPNGVGKTTLLTCLDRIGNSLAFAHGFTNSQYNDQIDQYKNTAITYEIENPKLRFTFHKGNKRWTATPRVDSSELTKFGYSGTVFIQANSKRIDVTKEDIKRGEFVNVSNTIKDELNDLFETDKYDKLKRLKNTRGRGKNAQYFYVIKDGNYYFSEKRFSTGELALLRLAETISNVEDNALILIDEAEMALHPRIQQNLIKYLKRKSDEKNLTVIISTHSVTMIKATDKNHILLLDEDELNTGSGLYSIINPCYPAKAIGCVDYIQNAKQDAIVFVEDEMAMLLFKKMLGKCTKEEKYSTITVSVVPVGGYENTAKLAINTKERLFAGAKVFAIWDEDVFSVTIPNDKNQRIKRLYDEHKDMIFNLGCTPELWMIEAIESGNNKIKNEIRNLFRCETKTIISKEEYKKCQGENPRKVAKLKLDVVMNSIESASEFSPDVIIDKLVDIILDCTYTDSNIKEIILPILGRIR